MAVRLGKEISVTIAVQGERVTAHFPPYSDETMKAAIRKLISSRPAFADLLGRDTEAAFDARVAFFDGACLRVDGIEDDDGQGNYVALTAEHFPDWKDRVPDNLKVSWASEFEEKFRLTEEQKGN
jgi:hypothetical protein